MTVRPFVLPDKGWRTMGSVNYGPPAEPAPPAADGRRAKGDRARAAIAHRAAHIASVDGLTGLSLARVADELGLSKSGVATLFGTKEALQQAAVAAARAVFVENVVRPALAHPRGAVRLRTLVDAWFAFITAPVLRGGCFRVATLAEFDSRPGPVRDAVAADHHDWLSFLTRQIGHVHAEPELLAFQVDALVAAANTANQLGDDARVTAARTLVDRLIG
ncbi:TetR/AcrR family transcriptional regulator [Nocardia jiangsuensis]|uniref:TetR/AcrR family transcriptional regulator n=1 Tax=Nocardia jiangsuensis TaxID=1691563 RepID=A0ABV8E1W2_9NOCA